MYQDRAETIINLHQASERFSTGADYGAVSIYVLEEQGLTEKTRP
jgi:hypothetical protein